MAYSRATVIWAAEISLTRRVDGASATLYVASNAGFTVSAASAVSAGFRMVLTQPVDVARTMFDDHKTTGSGRATVGRIRLESPEGQLDIWRQYIWDGGTFTLKRLATGEEYTTAAVTVLVMTIERAIFRQGEIEVQLRDWQRALEVPLQTDLYLGDNVDPDGIEGGAELKDKAKPIAYGHCRGINPVQVNGPKAIFQVNDGPIDSVVVRDRGIGLFPSLAFASRTSFTVANLHAVAAGNSLVVAGGAVDLTGTPGGALGKSADGGVTWTDLHNALAFGADEVTNILWAFGNKWIITGSAAKIKTSPDLVTFTARTSGFGAFSIDTICEGDGVVVIMGAGDKVSTTTDGVTWSYAPTGLSGTPNWKKCVKFRGQFVAVTDDGRVAVSSAEDGVNWQWVAPDPFLGLGANRPYQFVASDTLITTGAYGTATSPAGLSTSDTATAWVHEDFPGTPGFSSSTYSNVMTFGAGIYMHVGGPTVASRAEVGISTDGRRWTYQTLDMGNVAPTAVCFDDANETFVAVGFSGKISSSEADEYANTTDLEDDTLEPPAGFYKVCPSTGHFRVGFLEDASVIRADVVQGATSADRTAAQLAVQIMEDRAGFVASPNLVTSPSALATGWTATGTCSATNAVATSAGLSFSRITNPSGGSLYRSVTLTGNGLKYLSVVVKQDGTAAGWSYVILYDLTAGASRGQIKYTVAADGTITASANGYGTLVRARRLRGPYYELVVITTSCTAANSHRIYANDTGGDATLSSVLMSTVRVSDASDFDDYDTFDILALDDANSAECYFYTDRGDEVNCAQALDELIRTPGGSVFTDAYGVIRMKRLDAPAVNLVENPDLIASSPWVLGGGGVSATNSVGVYAGRRFTRINAADTGVWGQFQVLDAGGVYHYRCALRTNGVAGTVVVGVYDAGASAQRILSTFTIAASGAITLTSTSAGTFERIALEPGGEGVYVLSLRGTGFVAGNNHYIYACASGTATSYQIADVEVFEDDAVATIDQADMDGMEEAESSDPGAPAPPYQTKLKYRRNYAPMSGSDFAGDVDDADRAELSKDWHDVATAPDTAIQAAHPFSEARIEETNFAEQSDAEDEADRRQELHGVQRYWFDVPVFMTDATLALELNDVVEFTSTRFGMGAGQRARVMGIAPEAANGRMRLSGWL